MADSLLPPSSSSLERALASASRRASEIDIPLRALWSPSECPEHLLPWLAWALGVEEWDDGWPEQLKRDAVAAALTIRRHRGTAWAVKEALRAAGYAGAELVEGLPRLTHDGSQLHDGVETYAAGARWALFKLIADLGEERGVGGEELSRLLRLVERAKPVRSVLRAVEYRTTVTDRLVMDDPHAITAHVQTSEVRPAGQRYDGGLRHNQADQLPREIQPHDGDYRHTGELRHDGLRPYHEWRVHGTRYANRWDALDFGVRLEMRERHAVAAHYNGAAAHEGGLSHGAAQPPAVDAGRLRITRRRRHNGRLAFNGAQRYQGSAPDHHPL